MHEEKRNDITHIGTVNFRNDKRKFGIKEQDRFNGIYCVGRSGTGKSTQLFNMALSDIQSGKGLAIIDPHGDLAQQLIAAIPFGREKDVIIFDPVDDEFPSCFNPLEDIPKSQHHLVASNLVETFKRIWLDSWGPRLEYCLKISILTLLANEGTTLLHIKPLLTDSSYRAQALMFVQDRHILHFWEREFGSWTPSFRNEVISPILNKAGVFHTSTPLKNALGQEISDFSIKDVMDGKKILIANLSKGKLGEDASTILGSILTTAFMNGALSRSYQPEHTRVPFFLFIDECHSFVNSSFAKILSECRKYKLGVFLTHQYLDQLDESTQNAISGNVGTIIAFRVGTTDAPKLALEFHPVFDAEDLLNLPQFSFYIKLMINGVTSKPFSANSIKQ